jgi:hypothetical protein
LEAAIKVAGRTRKFTHRMVFIAAIAEELKAANPDLSVTDVTAAVAQYKIELPLLALSRTEKLTGDAERRLHFKHLRQHVPEKYQSLVDKAENGSRAAAAKLNCLECANYQVAEVRHCGLIHTCPMWAFRPFRPKRR